MLRKPTDPGRKGKCNINLKGSWSFGEGKKKLKYCDEVVSILKFSNNVSSIVFGYLDRTTEEN